MTPDQVRDYLSARNACGAPSAQTQGCIDDVHKKFKGVDPKCQTAYGPALTDCMNSMSKADRTLNDLATAGSFMRSRRLAT